MKRAVLFRFHKNPELCKDRLRLLKELNPEVNIYGLGENINRSEELKEAGLEDIHVVDDKDSEWKWMNGDLAVRDWFKNKGKNRDFDMLHVVEWDLLLAAPLDEIYGHISKGSLGLSGLKPIDEAENYGWSWITGEYRDEWRKLREWVESQTGYSGESFGCIFPGCCLPRSFLEEYSDLDVPAYSNDEVRVPLIAEALGYKLERTGLYPEWGQASINRYFNATGDLIHPEKIRRELEKTGGRRAFHPVRDRIGKDKVMKWKDQTS